MTRIRPIRKLRSIPHKRWYFVAALGLALVALNIYSRYQPIHAVVLDSEDSWVMVSFRDGYAVCILLDDWLRRDPELVDKDEWAKLLTHMPRWKDAFAISRFKDPLYRTSTSGVFLVADQLLLLAILAIYPLIAGICALVRHRRRARTNHCTRCGYCLTGNVTGICSECGTLITASSSTVDRNNLGPPAEALADSAPAALQQR